MEVLSLLVLVLVVMGSLSLLVYDTFRMPKKRHGFACRQIYRTKWEIQTEFGVFTIDGARNQFTWKTPKNNLMDFDFSEIKGFSFLAKQHDESFIEWIAIRALYLRSPGAIPRMTDYYV